MTRRVLVSVCAVVCLATLPSLAAGQTNQPPVVEVLDDVTRPEGEAESIAVVASDPEGSPLAYSASNLPPGVAIHDVTGVISGTLTYEAAGDWMVTVGVSDGALTTTRAFVWTVTNTNRAPTLQDPGDRWTTAGYERLC